MADIFVKQKTSHYVDLVDWDGMETIELTILGGDEKWSHIDLTGKPGTRVPDTGSTLILLGLGLGLIAFLKRRK